MSTTATASSEVSFQTHPDAYRHWKLSIEGDLATLAMAVDAEGGQRPDYELKLNSYDLSVDVELADAIQRLRFEHPEVRCVVLTGALDRVFCAGANIVMLRSSTHGFKVNFCKFTNETRLAIEDASQNSNIRFLAALNGTASGGGYELALACDQILLVDDRNSAVSFPEVPLLGVLPGTGGLTRITDKRKIRRDRCDVFASVAEGIKGKRALEWNLIDRLAPLSRWDEAVQEMAREMADSVGTKAGQGVSLGVLRAETEGATTSYRYLTYSFDAERQSAELSISAPEKAPQTAEEAYAEGGDWWILQAFRELEDAILNLRINHSHCGLILLRAKGSRDVIRSTDAILAQSDAQPSEQWFVNEVRHFVKRTLKRVDQSAKSFFAVADQGTSFVGTFLDLALACDRVYLLNEPEIEVQMGVTAANAGLYPMANGMSRLEARFYGTPECVTRILEHVDDGSDGLFEAETADELGLATFAPDEIDWEDELRLAIEERLSFSPDALTGMEANLRHPGPETMETRIFGRLSAWQNWIFQRPNAVGERGALKCYGTPQRPEFDYHRT